MKKIDAYVPGLPSTAALSTSVQGWVHHYNKYGLMVTSAILTIVSCYNPFFPPTGVPTNLNTLRAKPQGVITQLINSYEQKNIILFEELFPASGLFQFYVSPSFLAKYETRSYANPPEPRDPRLIYIPEAPLYYFWRQEVEIKSHRELFRRAESITFTEKPNVDIGKIHYLVNDQGDTTNAELIMENGKILIKVNLNGIVDEYTIWIEKQVFFLERDAEKLWVILKWYDFGSEGG
jgi:hypothetical protein